MGGNEFTELRRSYFVGQIYGKIGYPGSRPNKQNLICPVFVSVGRGVLYCVNSRFFRDKFPVAHADRCRIFGIIIVNNARLYICRPRIIVVSGRGRNGIRSSYFCVGHGFVIGIDGNFRLFGVGKIIIFKIRRARAGNRQNTKVCGCARIPARAYRQPDFTASESAPQVRIEFGRIEIGYEFLLRVYLFRGRVEGKRKRRSVYRHRLRRSSPTADISETVESKRYIRTYVIVYVQFAALDSDHILTVTARGHPAVVISRRAELTAVYVELYVNGIVCRVGERKSKFVEVVDAALIGSNKSADERSRSRKVADVDKSRKGKRVFIGESYQKSRRGDSEIGIIRPFDRTVFTFYVITAPFDEKRFVFRVMFTVKFGVISYRPVARFAEPHAFFARNLSARISYRG